MSGTPTQRDPSSRGKCACGKPSRDAGFICEECTEKLDKELAVLAAAAATTVVTYMMQARIAEKVGGSRSAETSLPFDDSPREAILKLSTGLGDWVAAFLPGYVTGSTPSPLCAATWLRDNLPTIRCNRQAPAFVVAINKLSEDVQRAVDRPADRWYAGMCLEPIGGDEDNRCGVHLYADPTKATIKCKGCRAVHAVAARRKWLLEASEDVLASASEISSALTRFGSPVTKVHISRWKTAGRLLERGKDPHTGNERYRVGDVIDLQRQDADARARRDAKAARKGQVTP